MGNESYVSSVFLTEAHEGTRVGEGFDVLKEKFNSLKLAEPAGVDKNSISEKTGKFFETFSRGYKSVEHMEEIAGDSNKTETQKQFAMDDLDLLGKVVYDSVRDNEKFTRLIGQGSASEIDENLPKEFKGIGKMVLMNVFEDGPVLNTLRELDISIMELVGMPEGREKKKLHNQLIREAMEKLAHMKNLTSKQNYDKKISLPYLELKLEDGKTGKAKSEKIQETRTQKTEINEKMSEVEEMEIVEENLEKAKLAETEEEQLKMVRLILDRIESQRDIENIYQAGRWISDLETEIEKMSPKVAIEVNSRLKLKHCDYFMKLSAGWIDRQGVTMSAAADTLQSKGRELGREEIKFLFNPEGANGMPVAQAWDLLQKANFFYKVILNEIIQTKDPDVTDEVKKLVKDRLGNLEIKRDNDPELGNVETNYYSDNTAVKDIARNYLIGKLSQNEEFFGGKNLDDGERSELSKKAVYLAESLAIASQEIAIWNRGTLTGNNELADMIGISHWRSERDKKGRPVGPRYHLNLIDNIGATSWLRYTAYLDSADRSLPKDMLKAEKIYEKINNFNDGGYQYFFSVFVSGKIFPLFDLLKKRDPKPKDTDIELLKKAVDYFNKADPQIDVLDLGKDRYVPVTYEYMDEAGKIREKEGEVKEGEVKKDSKPIQEGVTYGLKFIEYNGEKRPVGSITNDEKFVYFGNGKFGLNIKGWVKTPDDTQVKIEKIEKIEKNKTITVEFIKYQGKQYFVEGGKATDVTNEILLGGEKFKMTKAKTGKEQLKVLWLAGVVQMAVTNPLLDWNLDDILEMGRMASEQKLSPESGSFITKRQWNEIVDRLDVYTQMRKLQKQRRIRGSRKDNYLRDS